MSVLANIQPFVQECAKAIAEILEIEVTIVDESCLRIGGTGLYSKNIGKKVPFGSYFQSVLATGKPGAIYDVKKQPACKKCTNADNCLELATMGFPIFKNGHPVGVIGLIAFTVEQRTKIIELSSKLGNFLEHISNLLESKILLNAYNEKLQDQVKEAMKKVNKDSSFDYILGNDLHFRKIIDNAREIASGNSTIMIRGESGTGKELIARAVHSASPRRNSPFVTVNCASGPEQLIESELFGYMPGAFTGASRTGKIGKFELADKGTIFLDEIGDMPIAVQPKVLRALQEKSIDRIGGEMPISINVRIIAATNRNLEEMIRQGVFREDLYYRLNVIPIDLPSLRQRATDIPLYAQHFLARYATLMCKNIVGMEDDLVERLQSYSWPGNVRQLENVIEYMVNVCKTDKLLLNNLPDYLRNVIPTEKPLGLEDRVEEYEKSIILRHVRRGMSTTEKARIAAKLKISLATLYRKMEKYHIS